MTRALWTLVLLGIWGALVAASVLVAAWIAPTGDGFVRGMNRIGVFLQFQGLAAVVGFVIWRLGRGLPRGGLRWLSRLPAVVALGFVLVIVGLIVVARIDPPVPESLRVPAGPVTQPVQ